jgi:hypothetical protein
MSRARSLCVLNKSEKISLTHFKINALCGLKLCKLCLSFFALSLFFLRTEVVGAAATHKRAQIALAYQWVSTNEHYFLRNTVQTQALTYTRIHSHTPYPYEYLRKTEPVDWIWNWQVTTCASLSMGTSPPTEWIRLYATHGCQTWDLNFSELGIQPPF